jgi:hypothetical protein
VAVFLSKHNCVQQITDTILMVRPANFGYNDETAENNAFQSNVDALPVDEIKQRAREEFDVFVHELREAGIDVIVVEDTPDPLKTDAVFPNNWISFHEEGTIVTYPMFAPRRRQERREDVVRDLSARFGYTDHFRMEESEEDEVFLEGTGSMILDRINRIAYACLSVRTNEELLKAFAKKMNYEVVAFNALDMQGDPIYHTNVMMALGETFVIICLDTVRDDEERQQLLNTFDRTNKQVIGISLEQMMAFAGNALQVKNKKGDTFLVMSEQAYGSLSPNQREDIESHTGILFSPLKVIEKYGGGSARCMMAEVFKPGNS